MEMKVVEEELRKGWEATSQLRSLLLSPPQLENGNESSKSDAKNHYSHDNNILPFLEAHYTTIINSFNTAISILKQYSQSSEHSVCQTSKIGLKTSSRTIETSNLEPDVYAWRKYGEKPIFNTKHPREYYRCGYRDDQNCQATKHIQKISDNPTKYRISYYAHHTCNHTSNLLLYNNNASRMEVSNPSLNEFNNLISFESKNIPNQILYKPNAIISPTFITKTSEVLFSHSCEFPKWSTTTNNPPPNLADSLKIPNIVEINDDNCCKDLQPADLMYSPIMSPNYMASSYVSEECGLTAGYEQLFELGDSSILQDIPFKEMNDGFMWE